MHPITIVGSANIDFVVSVERLPAPGETVVGGDLLMTFGGKGANQAVAVRRLGHDALFVCKTGQDVLAERYRDTFKTEHLRVEPLAAPPGTPTGSALILVDRQGQNIIAVSPGANAHLLPADMDQIAPKIGAARLLVLQCEIPLETNLRALTIAQDHNVPVVFNPSPVPSGFPWGEVDLSYLVLNEGELAAITNTPDRDADGIVAAAQTLLAKRVETVIVTRGAQPTLAVTRFETLTVPTFPITPVDTVGAGDAFAGALAVALAEGKDLAAAIEMANAAGALTATRRGAQVAIPRRDELDAFLLRHATSAN